MFCIRVMLLLFHRPIFSIFNWECIWTSSIMYKFMEEWCGFHHLNQHQPWIVIVVWKVVGKDEPYPLARFVMKFSGVWPIKEQLAYLLSASVQIVVRVKLKQYFDTNMSNGTSKSWTLQKNIIKVGKIDMKSSLPSS